MQSYWEFHAHQLSSVYTMTYIYIYSSGHLIPTRDTTWLESFAIETSRRSLRQRDRGPFPQRHTNPTTWKITMIESTNSLSGNVNLIYILCLKQPLFYRDIFRAVECVPPQRMTQINPYNLAERKVEDCLDEFRESVDLMWVNRLLCCGGDS